MPSVRQQILTEVLTRLEGITVAQGFQTDAGAVILLGETPALGPDDPAAAIGVVVRDEIPLDLASYGESADGVIAAVLPIEVQVVVKPDLDQPWATVEAAIADVKTAIETSDRSLSGLLAKALGRGRIRVLARETGSLVVGAAIEYRAAFAEQWGGAQA